MENTLQNYFTIDRIEKMLSRIFSQIFHRHKKTVNDEIAILGLYQKATELMSKGDRRGAIIEYRNYLIFDPYNVGVLNNLGVCLADVGDVPGANAAFELAYSLDDTYIPVVVNHAKTLMEQRKSGDALQYLEQAKVYDPTSPYADAVYGAMCINNGDITKALHFQFRAWMADFDNLRIANCYLFYSSFADVEEVRNASEHRFWAETVRPVDVFGMVEIEGGIASEAVKAIDDGRQLLATGIKKIKIGYISPDFRSHSVRYFFRPLLENHDRSIFDIYVYHDCAGRDEQTELIESSATSFYDVSEMPDEALFKLLMEHKLDVLVELAGHSSHNRIPLFMNRFAPVQLSALGYPPTTGLSSIDAKIMDKYTVTKDSTDYYAEHPVALQDSFWCFDPCAEISETIEPPSQINGYITFGCAGNIAKINDRMLRCWQEILVQVPDSQLLIRSISFEDPAAELAMTKRLEEANIDISRVKLKKPESALVFFQSYSEIDVILDTFPFNGGTTTCFAVYMGVPVVSLVGKSLISRMGLSVLSNLGIADLAVYTEDSYIQRAVAIARDYGFLKDFRKDARRRIKASSLGDGKAYAKDFEQACQALLVEQKRGRPPRSNDIPILPANEIVRRAYAVLRTGQEAATKRILSHCLIHYPDCDSAHLLVAQMMAGENKFEEAIKYLIDRTNNAEGIKDFASTLNIIRWLLILDKGDIAEHLIKDLLQMESADVFDRMQLNIYQGYFDSLNKDSILNKVEINEIRSIHLLIPCDSEQHFEAMKAELISECWCPGGWSVTYQRCEETKRVFAYDAALRKSDSDALVIIQKTTKIHNAHFFVEIIEALRENDVVGVAGATRWGRIDWRGDEFNTKVAGFMVHSSEKPGAVEIQLLGDASECLVNGLAVLDGGLLATIPSRLKYIEFDAELDCAEWMLEEDWTHSVFLAGGRLAVHRNLGVLLDRRPAQDIHTRAAGLIRIQEKYHFDLFSTVADDTLIVSAPVKDMDQGRRVIQQYFKKSGLHVDLSG